LIFYIDSLHSIGLYPSCIASSRRFATYFRAHDLILLYNALSYLIARRMNEHLIISHARVLRTLLYCKKTIGRLNISILRLPSTCTRHHLPSEMGKSAKVHKRTKQKTSSAGTSTTTLAPKPAAVHVAASVAAASAAKKVKLKGNIKKRAKLRSMRSSSTTRMSTGGHHHVLGGADYVDIMMGSRRREREEALKLPRDTDNDVQVVSESPPTRT